MKVLLCGGGNAIHVLSSFIGSKPDCDVSILTLFAGEAGRLSDALPEEGIKCENDLGPDTYGKPVAISDDPAEVTPGSDIVIFAIPSFGHQLYLEALKPHLKPGVILGAMPGEGGFDLCARHVLGDDFVNKSNLFALETLPWACRITEYGKSVEVLGTKKEIDVVITPKGGESIDPALKLLQKLVGKEPIMEPACNFLGVTLMNINSVWHPTISYGYYRNKDVTKHMDEPPLFYQGADEYTGEKLAKVSDEVLELKRVLLEKYSGLDLSSVHHVREWMLRSYGDDIGDTSSIHKMLLTNKGYRGLTHPTVAVDTPEGKKYLPNFKYRYFSEDIPMGLMVTRGIAELAGVPTPHMDDVILWCQEMMGKEFLKDGKVAGKDLASTRAPQLYGFNDLDSFMKANRYVEASASEDKQESRKQQYRSKRTSSSLSENSCTLGRESFGYSQ
uniref:Opine dehydrogenase domain-containing protein n=1 Tax=Pseudictyota dubia TaxID=2749911 RepID=A0A7R9Z8Z1_9STRA|eukprot:CAMPEP_0197468226 /NCGR_PEP_ID=MMETSP1175-20131217/65964_1 /TAXON_ID=1003142 /ORGANISM="Triceratium dubium, Strain CCMP147" /LENGTH=444 /DNA_ID=CAMNT_0043004321 /DNA_START=165 /DNA_END=1499 /DNA_ORIENTATION=+